MNSQDPHEDLEVGHGHFFLAAPYPDPKVARLVVCAPRIPSGVKATCLNYSLLPPGHGAQAS